LILHWPQKPGHCPGQCQRLHCPAPQPPPSAPTPLTTDAFSWLETRDPLPPGAPVIRPFYAAVASPTSMPLRIPLSMTLTGMSHSSSPIGPVAGLCWMMCYLSLLDDAFFVSNSPESQVALPASSSPTPPSPLRLQLTRLSIRKIHPTG
jgi:hypothetical protein